MTVYVKADSKTDAREKINELLNKSELECSWDILEAKSYDEAVNE